MVEVALASVAKSALTLFTSLAKNEFTLLWNSQQEFERFQHTIDTINCFLHDADKMYSNELAVQNCLLRLRNILYDVDDFFDGLAAQALRKKTMSSGSFSKEVRIFFSKSNHVGTAFKIAHKVKSLKKSLDHVEKDMRAYGFKEQPQPVVQHVRRADRYETLSLEHPGNVIGRTKEIDSIISMLLLESEVGTSQKRGFSVVAVIGFGGLGKTTLAQYVYTDEKVKRQFDVCFWACINNLSNLKQALVEIIRSKEEGPGDHSLEILQRKLRSYIGGKRFLLVIDDLWDESEGNWKELKKILDTGINGKVLVTTRSNKVAQILDAQRVDLKVLSDEDALALFEKKVGEVGNILELKQLGKKIVSRCGNVPLAIIVIGSVLRHKDKDVLTWRNFLDNELGKDLLSSDNEEIKKHIKAVLMISYKDLHPNLKRCFAYCSLFPKGYLFEEQLMIRLWISQGFIEQNDDNTRNLEEVGRQYFSQLVDRCFFQHLHFHCEIAVHDDFIMHDLLHDVAIDVAKTEILLLDKDHTSAGSNANIRHISVDLEVDASFNYCDMVTQSNRVRSILTYYSRQPRKTISPGSLDMLLTNFKSIRMLDLPNTGVESIPDSIGKLVHMRYVDFSGNRKLRHLPNSICKLHHLTTISVRNCTLLEELPQKIEKLVSLRHLLISGCSSFKSLPSGLEALTSLVNLDRLIVHGQSGGLGYLNSLNSLSGVLSVQLPRQEWPNAIEDAGRSEMSGKCRLQSLILSWEHKCNESCGETVNEAAGAVLEALEPHENLQVLGIKGYGGKKLPGWLCMLKNLTELSLSCCGHLEYIEDEMKANIGLPALKTLTFQRMKILKGWWRQEIPEESQRPCLAETRTVTIRDCPEFTGPMPLFEKIGTLDLDRVAVELVTELLFANTPNCSSTSSFSPLSQLWSLQLSGIKGLTCFPKGWIRNLVHLKHLDISDCTDLRGISRLELGYLINLNTLKLWCDLVDEDGDDIETQAGMPWKTLQSLQVLGLEVWDSQFPEGLAYLTSIKELQILKWKCEEDVELASKMLRNLHKLNVGFGQKTCDLRKTGIQNLPCLTVLTIQNCKEVNINWQTLLSTMGLEVLSFFHVHNVTDFENMVIEHPSQLQQLLISFCCNLEAKWVHDIPWNCLTFLKVLSLNDLGGEIEEQIPDGIQHLSSLRTLTITGWRSVKSVPIWFRNLTSLESLSIKDCSEELRSRCEKEKGLDWPLICHVDNFSISPRYDLQNESEDILPPKNEEKGGWCGIVRR